MIRRLLMTLVVGLCVFAPVVPVAQDGGLMVSTVTRPPFSMIKDGQDVGFSIDLMRAVAEDLGREVTFQRAESFVDMLTAAETGTTDGAIANISITAAREARIDFTQPIFESGIQIMVPYREGEASIFSALFTLDILLAILAAFGILFVGGMLMWLFERRRQPYFDRNAKDAMFPSFWWALNLVVNGGFEERMPQSRPGRFFAVMLVIASLFIVSIFVAKITAALTVEAIQSKIESINDLEGRRVATIGGSTTATYLDTRGIDYRRFDGLEAMLAAFEAGTLDAVVFDGPILAYYVRTQGHGRARLVPRVFRPENYGMALPQGSALREPINQSLLKLRENGTYDQILIRWFGPGYGRR